MSPGQYYGVVRSRPPEDTKTLLRNVAQVDHSAENLGLTFDAPASVNWSRHTAQTDMLADQIGLTFDALADKVFGRNPASAEMIAEALGLSFDTPTALNLTRAVAQVSMICDNLGITFESPEALELLRNPAAVDMLAENLGLTFDAPAALNWTRAIAQVEMLAQNLGLSFDTPADLNWSRSSAQVDMTASNLGLSFDAPAAVNWSRSSAEVDMSAESLGLVFGATGIGTNASFNGVNAYLWRTDTGYLSGVNSGTWWTWFRSGTPLGAGTEQTLFAASNGETPRIEMGLRSPLAGETELYIETDDGNTTRSWRLPLTIDLFDGQWHLLAISSTGTSYGMAVDGVFQPGGYGTDDGTWFGHVAATSGEALTMVSSAAFRRNGTVGQFYQGELDEMAIGSYQFAADTMLDLWNNGDGWHIPDIENRWPALWNAVSQAWELTNLNGKQFGREYKSAENAWFTVENVVQGAGGILGFQDPFWDSYPNMVAVYQPIRRLMINDADLEPAAGEGVKSWYNLLANENHLTQATAANRLVLEAVADGSGYALRGGTDRSIAISAFAQGILAQPNIVWVVQQAATTTAAAARAIIDSEFGNRHRINLALNGLRRFVLGGTAVNCGTVAAGAIELWCLVSDGLNSRMYVNGGAPAGSGDAGSDAMNGISVASIAPTGGNYPGLVRSIAVHNGTLPNADIDAISDKLATFHGLTWTPVV